MERQETAKRKYKILAYLTPNKEVYIDKTCGDPDEKFKMVCNDKDSIISYFHDKYPGEIKYIVTKDEYDKTSTIRKQRDLIREYKRKGYMILNINLL